MKLIFIRHADPDNEHNTLTENGKIEAKVLGKYLKQMQFDDIYTSPYPRAKMTADEIIKYHPEKELIIKDWLHEFDYQIILPGAKNTSISWDLYPEFYTNIPTFYDNDKYLDLPFLKDYGIKEKYNEVIKEFDELLKNYGYERFNSLYKVNNENEKTILFVCHFGLMSVLMSHLLNVPYTVISNTFICPPTGITTFISEERKKRIALFRCNGFADMSHLNNKHMKISFHGRFCEVFSSKDRH